MFGFTITDLDVKELSGYSQMITGYLSENVFRSHIAKTMFLSEAAHAHELVEGDKVNGKIILRVPQ